MEKIKCPKCHKYFISEDYLLTHFVKEHSSLKKKNIETGWFFSERKGKKPYKKIN